MNIKIGIRWFPRKMETFKESIGTIQTDNVVVYPDGRPFIHKTDLEVKQLGDHAGCFKHYYRVLEDLTKSDAEFIGAFSDDLLYRSGWIQTATQKLRDSRVGYVACFVPRGLQQRNKWHNGWRTINGGWASSYGGGYLMRKDVVLKVLEHPFMINHLKNYKANQQIDHCLPQVIHEMGLKQMFFVPSLMKHIGYESTIGHTHTVNEDVIGW